MINRNTFVVLSAVLFLGDAAFVDTLTQCGLKDTQCQKKLFQTVLKERSKTGIPEYNIPIFDPITLKDVNLPVLDIANLTLVEGKIKGLSSCVLNDFSTYVDSGRATMDLTCDITVSGNYKAFASSPLIKATLGGDSIRGDGKVKIKIEKLNLKFDFKFTVNKRDGETYLKGKNGKLVYKYEVLGKVVFAANNLFMGDQDVSATITSMLNQNWRLIMQTIGGQVMNRAMDRVKDLISNLFDHIPTKYFISDDLSAYVTN
ncbi:unnamed protein product [Diatraea saccharalis]|uniref:Uncharacterized protein n=1 Tax=Diatraea saccharalis TaxID=40085 RepID=A0A9N9WER9_9NEOP|nr:unnamed protein product [Diatraea saccharalis]